jgi:DNA-directed RNA polymerase subunit RPC12/RpoP
VTPATGTLVRDDTVTILFVRCASCGRQLFVKELPPVPPCCPSCFDFWRRVIARLCWK